MLYLGDFLEDATIPFLWSTNDAAGGSVDRATDGTIKVERDDGTDCTGTSITDSEGDPDTGLHRGSCDSSDNANFATNHFYFIWVDGAVIDGEPVNGYLACFSIEYAGLNKQVDVTKWLGTACSTPTTAGLPEVDVIHWDGTAVDGPDTAGVPNVNLVGIDGAKTDGTPAVASRPILYLQQFNLHCSLGSEGAIHAENDAGSGYGLHTGGSIGQHNAGTTHGVYNYASSGYGQRNQGTAAGLYNVGSINGHAQRNERAGSGKDVYLAGSGSIENSGGDILANLDAAISSRSSHTAAAVWSVTTRTLTSFGSLVATIWQYATRTLTGTGGGVGPTAGVSTVDIRGQVFKESTRPLCARVYLVDGSDAQQADVAAIEYTIYELDKDDPDTWTAVAAHTAKSLTVADVIFDTLQYDAIASDYNFKHTPDVAALGTAFGEAGKQYLVVYTLTPAVAGQDITMRFRLDCI